ncbi:MAG: hypothetical protein ACM3MK_02515 [Chitinophagales bacterium]
MLNTFFARVELAVVVERIQAVPFSEMALEELEDEPEEVREYVVKLVDKMAADELEHYQAYMEK